jgi:excisionase family DNA binding protein
LYLTVKEAAEYLLTTESAVKSLIQQKKIRAIYDGNDVYNNIEIKL